MVSSMTNINHLTTEATSVMADRCGHGDSTISAPGSASLFVAFGRASWRRFWPSASMVYTLAAELSPHGWRSERGRGEGWRRDEGRKLERWDRREGEGAREEGGMEGKGKEVRGEGGERQKSESSSLTMVTPYSDYLQCSYRSKCLCWCYKCRNQFCFPGNDSIEPETNSQWTLS